MMDYLPLEPQLVSEHMGNPEYSQELNNSVSSLTQTFEELTVIHVGKKFDGSIPENSTEITPRRRTKSAEWTSSSSHSTPRRGLVFEHQQQCLRKDFPFMSCTTNAAGDEQTLASTQICTDDEHESVCSSIAMLGASHSSFNWTTTNTSKDTPPAIVTGKPESPQSSSEIGNDDDPPQEHDHSDYGDEGDDDSVMLSFDRMHTMLSNVVNEENDDDEVDYSDDDDDDPHSYLHHSFQSWGGHHGHHESKHSLSLHRLEETSEANTISEHSLSLHKATHDDETKSGRVSFSIQQLVGMTEYDKLFNDENRDDSENTFNAAESDDKVNPLMHESVFHSSDSTVSLFPADFKEWTLVKILGQGNFGQVWQVDRKDLSVDDDRSYALKMLSKYQMVCDGEVDCVIAEKRIMQLVNEHPFVTKLRAAWQDDNLVYFLQDFLQGGELFSLMLDKEKQELHQSQNSLLAPRKAMAESHVQFYTACIADALHYMHSKRICYRDLKPENALLDEQGYPVLIDLGAAKLLPPDCDRTFTMTGTPRYVAPELINGSGHSFGVDHWALAVLAYEMLTGEHPFDEWDMEDEMLLFEAIAEADYRPLSTTTTMLRPISDHAKNWIDQLLVKDPSQRLGCKDANFDNPLKKCDLLAHPWLAGLHMTELRRRAVPAPWRPRIANHHDSSFFDDWDHLEPVVRVSYPPLTAREAAKFDLFDAV